ncbi:MAG: helicase-related protein [Acidilobaceae archaeon]|nr:helicase-related protein [Acidilobaceae archaeon]
MKEYRVYSVACPQGEARLLEPPESVGALLELLLQFPSVLPPKSLYGLMRGLGVRVGVARGGALLFPELQAMEGASLEELLELACREGLTIISRELKGAERGRLKLVAGASQRSLSALEAGLLDAFSQLYGGLKPNEGQRAAFRVIPRLLEEGGSLVVIMSTGSGKSAIFHASSRLASGLLGSYSLLVSPLRALMRDQVSKSSRLGLRAAFLDSSVPEEERERLLAKARRGELELLLVSPERLLEGRVRRLLEESPPALFVLDEVHAVVEWGYSFRPSYAYAAKVISSLRRRFRPPVIALTATISQRSLLEVLRLLGHEEPPSEDYEGPYRPVVIRARAIRGDISFEVLPAPQGYERLEALERVVRRNVELSRAAWDKWLGLVFTSYVSSSIARWANVDTIAGFLKRRLDVEVLKYHGSMRDEERLRAEERLRGLEEGVLVSTKAFGMGVDLQNVRWVVHYIMSDSIEEYYQEVGRAGRDGKGAVATLLYNPADADLKLSLSSAPRLSFVMRLHNTLAAILKALEEPGYVILPDDVLGAPRQTLRALEALRGAGLLDYHVISGAEPRIAEKGKGYYMKLNEGIYVALVGERSVEYSACHQAPLYSPVMISSGASVLARTGKCIGPWRPLRSKRLIVVEPLGEMEVTASPPRELFVSLTREKALEEVRVERLRELVEKVMVSEDKSKAMREGVEKYLEEDRAFSRVSMERLALGIVKCARCYERVAGLVKEAEESLGRRGVTLYCDGQETCEGIYRAYSMLFGSPMKVRGRNMASLSALIGSYGAEKLCDRGLIVMASKSTQTALRLARVLEDYRYFSAFLW